MAVRVVATGRQAMRVARDLGRLFGPLDFLSEFGARVRVRAGTIDRRKNICILGQHGGEVYVLRGNRLEASTQVEFVRDYFVGEVFTQVYQSTYWIVPVGEVVMAFAMACVGGFVIEGVAMTAVNLVQLAVKGYVVYQHCPGQINTATRELPRALGELAWFKLHCPFFSSGLESVMADGELSALRSFRPGATDIAELIGSLLAGGLAAHATEFGFKGLLILLAQAGQAVAQSAAQEAGRGHVAALPGAVGAGGVNPDAYVAVFRQHGARGGDAFAQGVRTELRSPEAATHLHTLHASLGALAPAMQTILQNWPSH